MIYIVRPYAGLPSDGAANDRYVNLCCELRSRGMAVSMLCSSFMHNKKAERSEQQKRFNKSALPFLVELSSVRYKSNISIRRVLHELFFGLKALALVMTGKPKLVLVGEPLFFVGWLFVLYGMVSRTRIIADVIDIWPEADTRSFSDVRGKTAYLLYSVLRLSRKVRLKCYHKVSFVSTSYASMLGHSASHAVFYWGSDLLPDSAVRDGRKRITIVYAGSFGNGYDISALLDAAKLLAERKAPRFSVIIAGGGQQEALVKQAAEHGYVEYLGYINKQQLVDLYMRADIGVLPYKAKSMVAMPIKFFDYVNFGIYTVSSLTLEVAQVIHENAIGMVYKPGDGRDLYEKIVEVSLDSSRLAQISPRCARLAERYSIKNQYGAFADFVAGKSQ